MEKVHINMCPILDGYGVITVLRNELAGSCTQLA